MTNIIEILKQILEVLNKNNKQQKTFTVQGAAAYSGIGECKIRELVNAHNSDFPYFKVGARVMIDREAFDIWLKKITEEHREL